MHTLCMHITSMHVYGINWKTINTTLSEQFQNTKEES